MSRRRTALPAGLIASSLAGCSAGPGPDLAAPLSLQSELDRIRPRGQGPTQVTGAQISEDDARGTRIAPFAVVVVLRLS